MNGAFNRTQAVPHDHSLRYMVPSTRRPKDPPYLVQLDSYGGNGQCCCKHFLMRLEPLLARAVTPQQAVDEGLVKLKENRHVEDALRCEHILTARSQFCDAVIKAISDAQKIHSNQAQRRTA